MDNHYLLSAYREDVNKKVYLVPFYQANPNIEYLLYDFSLGVGDSVHTYGGVSISTTIESIDSIFIQGTYRKNGILVRMDLWRDIGNSFRVIHG